MGNKINRIIREEIDKLISEMDGGGVGGGAEGMGSGVSSVGGATSTMSTMQGGGSNPDSGQFIQPMTKVQRRNIYKPKTQQP